MDYQNRRPRAVRGNVNRRQCAPAIIASVALIYMQKVDMSHKGRAPRHLRPSARPGCPEWTGIGTFSRGKRGPECLLSRCSLILECNAWKVSVRCSTVSVVIDKGWNDVMQVRIRHKWAFQRNYVIHYGLLTPQKAMGYGVSEVYGLSPLSQLEKGPYVWDIKGYGLWQVWVIRSSTVPSFSA